MQIDKEKNGTSFECDCYGSGEDLVRVKEESAQKGLPLQFHGAIVSVESDVKTWICD